MPMGLGRYIEAERKAFELMEQALEGVPGALERLGEHLAQTGEERLSRVVALEAIKRARTYLRRLGELKA